MIQDTKQVYYNQVRGVIEEINNTDDFPNITLQVGHNKKRNVNLVMKKDKMKEIAEKFSIGDMICLRFFVSSRFKHNRWYTMANVLEIAN